MSTAGRKARKREGQPFTASPKEPTAGYITRAERKASRRASRRAQEAMDAMVRAVLDDPAAFWREARGSL